LLFIPHTEARDPAEAGVVGLLIDGEKSAPRGPLMAGIKFLQKFPMLERVEAGILDHLVVIQPSPISSWQRV
jgi:hypothetical protein